MLVASGPDVGVPAGCRRIGLKPKCPEGIVRTHDQVDIVLIQHPEPSPFDRIDVAKFVVEHGSFSNIDNRTSVIVDVPLVDEDTA